MADNNDLDAALVDVRKAFRLLYLYQRRALDLCEEIRAAFNSELVFYGWSPTYHSGPGNSSADPKSRWAWDYLPLYDFSSLYAPPGFGGNSAQPGDWMLALRFSVDSGYKRAGNSEPDPREFSDPQDCQTDIILQIYYCTAPFTKNWFYDVYNNHRPGKGEEKSAEPGFRTLGMKRALSELSDSFAVGRVVEEFKTQLRKTFPDKPDW